MASFNYDDMNILIINPIMTTAQDGVIVPASSLRDTLMIGMAYGFHRLGHNVTLATAAEFAPTTPENYPFQILYFASSLTRLFPPHLIPLPKKFYSWLKHNALRFDMILTSETFTFYSLIATITAPRKTIIWQEIHIHQKKFFTIPSHLWYNLVARTLMRRVRLVIPRSKAAQEFISQYFSQVAPTIVKHGFDSTNFHASTTKERFFLSPSNLVPRKGIDRIITSFANFIKLPGQSDFKLIIAGEGSQRQQLRQLVRDLNVCDNVCFTGHLPHSRLGSLMARASATLFYSYKDLDPCAILQSILCATPVVTNSTPTSSDIIRAHSLGIIDDNWNAQTLQQLLLNHLTFIQHCSNLAPTFTAENSCASIISLFNSSAN